MSDRSKKPFHDAVHDIPPQKDPEKPVHIRDKDNADKRITPPRFSPFGERNRAPRGNAGIKRDLQTPEHQQSEKTFKLTGPGDLTREFKPIARGTDKDRGHDR